VDKRALSMVRVLLLRNKPLEMISTFFAVERVHKRTNIVPS